MSLVNTRIEAPIARQSVLDTREFEVQNGTRVAQVTAMFNDTVIDVQHLGQTPNRRKSAPAWLEANAKPVPQPRRPWLPPLIALTLGILTALFLRTR